MKFLNAYTKYDAQKRILRSFVRYIQQHLPESQKITVTTNFPWQKGDREISMATKRLTPASHTSQSPLYYIGEPNTELVGSRIFSSEHCEIIDLQNSQELIISQSEIELLKNIPNQLLLALTHNQAQKKPKVSHTYQIDISVWIDGELRSSQIIDSRFDSDSIAFVCSRIVHDHRFKALTSTDLAKATFEYSKLSKFTAPLNKRDVVNNNLPPSHGIRICSKESSATYLPLVHNCRRFISLTHKIRTLNDEKLPASQKKSPITTLQFKTTGIVFDQKTLTHLNGPVPVPINTQTSLKPALHAAAHFIINNTDSDGYIKPIISPDHRSSSLNDLPRQALACLALAHTHELFQDHSDTTLTKVLTHIETNLSRQNSQSQALTLAYLSQAYQKLNATTDAERCALEAYKLHCLEKFENTITRSQIARSLQLITHDGALSMAESLYDKFMNIQSSSKELSLAKFAELITISATHNASFHEHICEWYWSKILPDGTFPSTDQRSFVYIRGTLKVLESLASSSAEKAKLLPGLSWAQSMQYTPTSSYHLSQTEQFLGGFRHDYNNRDAWIDSAAHFIIFGSRFLEKQNN